VGLRLAGDLIDDENERGEAVVGETLLLLLNGHWEPIDFTLPETRRGHIWDRLFDTADPQPETARFRAGVQYTLKDRSVALLATRAPEEAGQPIGPQKPTGPASANPAKPPGASPI
jgi:glycogen operon protein